jgi:hypothetical protein
MVDTEVAQWCRHTIILAVARNRAHGQLPKRSLGVIDGDALSTSRRNRTGSVTMLAWVEHAPGSPTTATNPIASCDDRI